jgi:hypothetical protein
MQDRQTHGKFAAEKILCRDGRRRFQFPLKIIMANLPPA